MATADREVISGVISALAAQRSSTAGKTSPKSARGSNGGHNPLPTFTRPGQWTSIQGRSSEKKSGVASSAGRDVITPQGNSSAKRTSEKRTSLFREQHEKRLSVAEQLPQYPEMSLREALSKIAPRGSTSKPNTFLALEFEGALNAESMPVRPPGVTPSTARPAGHGIPKEPEAVHVPDFSAMAMGNQSSPTPLASQPKAVTNASALIYVSVPLWGMEHLVEMKVGKNTLRTLRSWIQKFAGDCRALDPKGKVLVDEMQAKDFDELEAVCMRGFTALDKIQADTRALEAGRGWVTPEPEEQPLTDDEWVEDSDPEASNLIGRGSIQDAARRSSVARGSVTRGSITRGSIQDAARRSSVARGSVTRGSVARGSVARGSIAKASEDITVDDIQRHSMSRGSVTRGSVHSTRGSVQSSRGSVASESPAEKQLRREIQKLQIKIEAVQKRTQVVHRKALTSEMQLKVITGIKKRFAETQTDPEIFEAPKSQQLGPLQTRHDKMIQKLNQPTQDASWEEVASWQDQMLDLLQQRMQELEAPQDQAFALQKTPAVALDMFELSPEQAVPTIESWNAPIPRPIITCTSPDGKQFMPVGL